MECNEVVKNYGDYRLGRLSAQVSESIAEHIQDCEDCFRMDESNREFVPEGTFEKFVRTNLEERK